MDADDSSQSAVKQLLGSTFKQCEGRRLKVHQHWGIWAAGGR
jgi:hypothetical protein